MNTTLLERTLEKYKNKRLIVILVVICIVCAGLLPVFSIISLAKHVLNPDDNKIEEFQKSASTGAIVNNWLDRYPKLKELQESDSKLVFSKLYAGEGVAKTKGIKRIFGRNEYPMWTYWIGVINQSGNDVFQLDVKVSTLKSVDYIIALNLTTNTNAVVSGEITNSDEWIYSEHNTTDLTFIFDDVILNGDARIIIQLGIVSDRKPALSEIEILLDSSEGYFIEITPREHMDIVNELKH